MDGPRGPPEETKKARRPKRARGAAQDRRGGRAERLDKPGKSPTSHRSARPYVAAPAPGTNARRNTAEVGRPTKLNRNRGDRRAPDRSPQDERTMTTRRREQPKAPQPHALWKGPRHKRPLESGARDSSRTSSAVKRRWERRTSANPPGRDDERS